LAIAVLPDIPDRRCTSAAVMSRASIEARAFSVTTLSFRSAAVRTLLLVGSAAAVAATEIKQYAFGMAANAEYISASSSSSSSTPTPTASYSLPPLLRPLVLVSDAEDVVAVGGSVVVAVVAVAEVVALEGDDEVEEFGLVSTRAMIFSCEPLLIGTNKQTSKNGLGRA
jgi:hypothetical protein